MALPSSFSYESYWSDFDVADDDLDAIYNLLLEREVPLTTMEMASALIEQRLERLEEEAKQAAGAGHEVYLPAEGYKVGQTLVFPAIGNAVGEVVGIREGENPDLGAFEVIEVDFEEDDQLREFAAKLEDHILNRPVESESDGDSLESVEGVLTTYGDLIEERLAAKLESVEDIVRIAGKWFPRALLAEINVGHLNLAEAALDVAEGGPLPTKELLEHIEKPAGIDPALMEFSVDYALQEDDRFDEVGPAGQVLWFLKRLEPAEVLYPPPRLESQHPLVNRSVLSEELLELERNLNDELSPLDPIEPVADEVTFPVLFPHWRVGALPLSARLQPLFPTAYEAPRIRFVLVDGHSNEKFPGWVVREKGYVLGLDEWYREYDVPAGGLIKVREGNQSGEVIVETVHRHQSNDWIRTVTIDESGQVGFTMLKQPIGTAYDDLMVVGLIDPVALDEAWLKGKQREMPIDRLVAHVFRELAKLTPQSAVHAKSLYACVNVIRRLPPAVVFSELVTRPYYIHVGDLYWRFEPDAWSAS
jgi:hypothetical protein